MRLIRRALESINAGMPPMSAAFFTNQAAAFTSPERARREREKLFLQYPLVVGFSSQLARPGDYISEDLTPVPILAVRQESGALKAFANICRHRGSRLVAGCGHASRFVCQYHAWSYEKDGRLHAIPDQFGFAGLDRDKHGLIELPVQEFAGLIWVRCAGGSRFSAVELLGGLEQDLESYDTRDWPAVETRTLHKPMNWKLVSDTFWEAYHLKVLHKKTIAPLFVRNLALFDAFGRNHRYVGVRESINELREVPEAQWDLLPHATILNNIFPNTVLVMQTDHVEIYRIFPDPAQVGRCNLAITILAPPQAASKNWSRTMDLLIGVVEEDFAVGEGIQRNFNSGAIAQVEYGRYEQALEHFHRSVRQALD